MKPICLLLSMVIGAVLITQLAAAAEPWKRHAVDHSFRGADGVRLHDVDGDGLQDIVTGWEESGVIRLYLHPGHERAAAPWPAVTVGQAASPEDAMPVDLDGDGGVDIVSCHEGKTRKLLVHWAPPPTNTRVADHRGSLLNPQHWQTDEITAIQGQMWMFATSIPWDRGARALVVGSKGNDAQIGLLMPPAGDRRKLADWRFVRLRQAGWIMSLVPVDMDDDGDHDIVYSDRKGSSRRAGWLQNPGPDAAAPRWQDHAIAGEGMEVMFLDAQPNQVLVATRDGVWLQCQRRNAADDWDVRHRPNPAGLGWGKAVRRIGSSRQGEMIVMTANTGDQPQNRRLPGVWLHTGDDQWQAIEAPPGGKYDRIECLDLDGDGDLDVLTCEERQNLGVVWYENPARP